jgi:hypothetical protein
MDFAVKVTMIVGLNNRLGKVIRAYNILNQIKFAKTDDSLPKATGTIKSLSLKIGFVNLDIWGLF